MVNKGGWAKEWAGDPGGRTEEFKTTDARMNTDITILTQSIEGNENEAARNRKRGVHGARDLGFETQSASDTTRNPLGDARGEARARSASEAFLFRRLQTLPQTKERFLLNENLPILFDGLGQMEVDFLCAESKLVIELDGAQHLADTEAYRRDRRKDELLQRHGYFVLRFLAEDLGKHLDLVLDTILAALVHRDRTHQRNFPIRAI